jgi:hypothetical protein
MTHLQGVCIFSAVRYSASRASCHPFCGHFQRHEQRKWENHWNYSAVCACRVEYTRLDYSLLGRWYVEVFCFLLGITLMVFEVIHLSMQSQRKADNVFFCRLLFDQFLFSRTWMRAGPGGSNQKSFLQNHPCFAPPAN